MYVQQESCSKMLTKCIVEKSQTLFSFHSACTEPDMWFKSIHAQLSFQRYGQILRVTFCISSDLGGLHLFLWYTPMFCNDFQLFYGFRVRCWYLYKSYKMLPKTPRDTKGAGRFPMILPYSISSPNLVKIRVLISKLCTYKMGHPKKLPFRSWLGGRPNFTQPGGFVEESQKKPLCKFDVSRCLGRIFLWGLCFGI